MEPVRIEHLFNVNDFPYQSRDILYDDSQQGCKFIAYNKDNERVAIVSTEEPHQETIVPVMRVQSNIRPRVNSAGTLVLSSIVSLDTLIVYDIKTKKKVNSCTLKLCQAYYNWISDESIVIVTLSTVYYWSTAGEPVKVFDRRIYPLRTIIGVCGGYQVDQTGNWHILSLRGNNDESSVNLEVYSAIHKKSVVIPGHTPCIVKDMNNMSRTVLCYATVEDRRVDTLCARLLDSTFRLDVLWSYNMEYDCHKVDSEYAYFDKGGCNRGCLQGIDKHGALFHLTHYGRISLLDINCGKRFYASHYLHRIDEFGIPDFYALAWRNNHFSTRHLEDDLVTTYNTQGDVFKISINASVLQKYKSPGCVLSNAPEGNELLAVKRKKKEKKKKKNRECSEEVVKLCCADLSADLPEDESASVVTSFSADVASGAVCDAAEIEVAASISSMNIQSLLDDTSSLLDIENVGSDDKTASMPKADVLSSCSAEQQVTASAPPGNIPSLSASINSLSLEQISILSDDKNSSISKDNAVSQGSRTLISGLEETPQEAAAEYDHIPLDETSPAASNTLFPSVHDKDESKLCIICFDEEFNTALVPCGHMWFCFNCANDIRTKQQPCPACRAEVVNVLRVYAPV